MRFSFFALAAAMLAAASSPAMAQLQVLKRADLSVPVTLAPNQGAIVVGFRRPDPMSAGKSGMAAFARYDLEKRDVVFQPRAAKKSGDTTTYWVEVRSGDKKLAIDYAVMPVTAGDYVLFGATPGPTAQVMNSFCLGAPTFTVKAGEVVYFGDMTPYIMVKMADGTHGMAMAYSAHIADVEKALAGQPILSSALKPANIRNEATYGCIAQAMMAYAVPGAPTLEPLPPIKTAAAPAH